MRCRRRPRRRPFRVFWRWDLPGAGTPGFPKEPFLRECSAAWGLSNLLTDACIIKLEGVKDAQKRLLWQFCAFHSLPFLEKGHIGKHMRLQRG